MPHTSCGTLLLSGKSETSGVSHLKEQFTKKVLTHPHVIP